MDEFDLFAVKSKKANKTNSSVRFLGESMACQSAFEINWPLVCHKKSKFEINIVFKCTHWRWMVIYSMNSMMIWLVQHVKYHTNQSSVFERSVFYLVRRPNLINDNHKNQLGLQFFWDFYVEIFYCIKNLHWVSME